MTHSIALLNVGNHIGFVDYNVLANLPEAKKPHCWRPYS